MEEKEYLDNYENRLQEEMVKLCTSQGLMSGQLLASEDLEETWARMAPGYMADSVSQINSFPAAAIAWAGYVGMAVAKWWDEDWAAHCNDAYETLHGSEGFDDMDEHIMDEVLHLSAEEHSRMEETMRSCAHLAMGMIRAEQIEAQSTRAFYVFARTERVMFRVGASLELARLGYRYEKVSVADLPADSTTKPS